MNVRDACWALGNNVKLRLFPGPKVTVFTFIMEDSQSRPAMERVAVPVEPTLDTGNWPVEPPK